MLLYREKVSKEVDSVRYNMLIAEDEQDEFELVIYLLKKLNLESEFQIFYAKNGIFEFDNFITGEKTPCSGEKSHFFKCHFPDLNPFQARSASLLPKKPWKRSPNANKYSRW